MRYLTIPILVIVMVPGPACLEDSGDGSAVLLPATGAAAGWRRVGAVRTFGADNLWEHLNGGAEKYLQAGVLRVLTADYRYDDVEAIVEVYVMGSTEGARSTFQSESSGSGQDVDLGDGAQLWESSLSFWKGPFLVRLVAFEQTPEVREALLKLGRAVERGIEQAGSEAGVGG